VKLKRMTELVEACHGAVCTFPTEFFGYFGWPTVAKMENGTLVAVASGLRNAHVCPFGRTVIGTSSDEGRTWTSPCVVNDSPLDDRDAGVISIGGKRLLLSWFSVDTRQYQVPLDRSNEEVVQPYNDALARMTDETVARWQGSWVRSSEDGGETWDRPVKVPLTAPHGPIRLKSGELLYLGKHFLTDVTGIRQSTGAIGAMKSRDGGYTWEKLGNVPIYEGTHEEHYHEPHVVELHDGRLLGLIRFQNHGKAHRVEDLGLKSFSLMQTESADGGETWTPAKPLGFHGSPPHLMRHSSGVIVCVYGFRQKPFGQRAMISHDEGKTWKYNYILRDDGPDSDLGYPSSVELDDGSILTVYYQKVGSVDEQCSILWTRWKMPN